MEGGGGERWKVWMGRRWGEKKEERRRKEEEKKEKGGRLILPNLLDLQCMVKLNKKAGEKRKERRKEGMKEESDKPQNKMEISECTVLLPVQA